MMLVQWDVEEERDVGTVAELDALLDELDAASRARPLPYAVTIWTGPDDDGRDGPSLTLVVGTDTSPVDWTTPDPPYGRASWNGGTDDEPYFVANYGGQWSELDAWMPIPIADAREAARRFFTSGGQCPDNLTWHPEGAHSAA